MQDTEMIVLALAAIAGLFALIASIMWRQKLAERAKLWPTAEATIQSIGMELVNLGGRSKTELPVYAFSYVAGGDYYSGRFSLQAGEESPAGSLRWELADKKFTVHYNPKRPSEFGLPDEIAGCATFSIPD